MDTQTLDLIDRWLARYGELRAELHTIPGWDDFEHTDPRAIQLDVESQTLMQCIAETQDALGSGSRE